MIAQLGASRPHSAVWGIRSHVPTCQATSTQCVAFQGGTRQTCPSLTGGAKEPCTCTRGGFQRMFFRGAGVKQADPVGLFFTVRKVLAGFSLSLATRFFSCQPTCDSQEHASANLHQSLSSPQLQTTNKYRHTLIAIYIHKYTCEILVREGIYNILSLLSWGRNQTCNHGDVVTMPPTELEQQP